MSKKQLKDKLDLVRNHITRPVDNKTNQKNDKLKTQQKNNIPRRYHRLAEKVGGELRSNNAGSYILISKKYEINYRQGDYSIGDITFQEVEYSSFNSTEQKATISKDNLLFFDSETTGLGGSGAVPFLIGCGVSLSNGFEIRQYLLPDFSDETAMLEDLIMEIKPDTTIVSYNGTAFDIPLINDRLIINRVARSLEFEYHVDLLHSSRRLYKRRIKDCSLGNIEKKILSFRREDDTPGYLIPSIYFEWLNSEETDLLPSVIEHNRYDIISLYFLISILNDVFKTNGACLNEVDDIHSLSRYYGKRKDLSKVEKLYRRISKIENRELSDDIIFFHSLNYKKIDDIPNAVELWKSICNKTNRESFLANIELAKYYEHSEKNPQKALEYTLKAKQNCLAGKSHKSNLANRLSRLNRKLESL